MPPHPWAVQRWAFDQKTGNAARKSVLMALAVMAAVDTGRCEAKIETLMSWTELSERSVQSHLKLLRETGLIAIRAQKRVDGGQRSNEYLLLMPGIKGWPDGEGVQELHPPPGAVGSTPRVQRAAPQELPLGNGHASRQEERAHEGQDDPRRKLPDGFPDGLLPHARVVYAALRRIAEDHGARKVWPKAVGQVLMAHPRHPLVGTVNAMAAWAVDPPRKIVDVVGTYRTFLSKERELEAVERLNGDVPVGNPYTGRAAGQSRRMNASEMLRALDGMDLDKNTVEGTAEEL